MLDKRHLTCRLNNLTLLDQQMLYNNVRTCSWGLKLGVEDRTMFFNMSTKLYMQSYVCQSQLNEPSVVGGSTIGLAECGIWIILKAGFGIQVKIRSGKKDLKYKRA